MNADTAAPAPEPSRSAGWGSLSLWLFGLLALYVLSIGPALKLKRNGLIPSHAMNVIYTPLNWGAENCEPFGRALRWYMFDVWHNPRPIIY